jgi:hypothetical protein
LRGGEEPIQAVNERVRPLVIGVAFVKGGNQRIGIE